MDIPGNLKEAEAWQGGLYLGIGTHPAEITSAAEGQSKKKHPQFEFEWTAIGGDEKGGTIREWLVVIPSTLGKLKGLLEACGVEITDNLSSISPSDLEGLKAAIVVRKENPDDKYPRVMGYLPLSDIPADTTGLGSSKEPEVDVPF